MPIGMGTLGLKIDDRLEERFRRAVFERKGMKKGNITDALEEAIKIWVDPDLASILDEYRNKAKTIRKMRETR